jgi:pyruvate dehydrogenase E1 component
MTEEIATLPAVDPPDMATLRAIERRVLWLSTAMVHHANRVRPNTSGVKVGGHQASSASMTTIMTALWFAFLRAPDRVSVKPHASPVLHAINHLLGRLDASYLQRLREFGGLQSYPSRTKDPDPVDFSTGSVGIGATAAIWSAIAHRYVSGHFAVAPAGRHIALLGDAELDEGAVWEAIADPMVARLGEVLWIVDLNRQSLDRVVPDIAATRLGAMFDAAGWHTVTVKWGRLLRELFARERGELLRERIERMPNEEYQRLLRADSAQLRERLPDSRDLRRFVADLEDGQLLAAIRDLGGHDLDALLEAYRETDAVTDRPSIVFAYTIKARGLATEGHPANHSALLDAAQLDLLAQASAASAAQPWAPLEAGSPAAALCVATARRLERKPHPDVAVASVPVDLGRAHGGRASTQQALGRMLVDLDHGAPEVAARVVTVSPDVSTSTNLGGWINRGGIWSIGERLDWFADDTDTLVRWREHDHGRHVELGIAEVNLVGLLGELGATWSRDGQPLLPIGTLYDPFVGRALEPWSFGIYAGGQSILVGTPSGITLAPEGGAHQSIVTPSIGIEQPGCVAWEPAFGQDLEWAILHALSRLGRPDGTAAYFRLSTRPVDQALAAVPADPDARERRRRAVLAGGYAIARSAQAPGLTLVGVGAPMVELLAAAQELGAEGIALDVVCLTSADLVFRALQARQGLADGDDAVLAELFPAQRRAPIVSVLDGHPHTLAFLAAVNATPIACLGTTRFGQSGDLDDLYRDAGIDAETIVGAALDLL